MHNPMDFYCAEKPMGTGSYADARCLPCRKERLAEYANKLTTSRGSKQFEDARRGYNEIIDSLDPRTQQHL